jgi:DNA replication protein DnaC
LNTSSTIFGLPRDYWHCTYENFDWSLVRPPELREVFLGFLRETEEGKAPHLLLCGQAGRGKSHLSVVAYRWGVVRWGTLMTTWLSVPDFCDAVKEGYDTKDNLFDDYEKATKLVVLDDVFGRDLSPHEATAIVYRLINIAYQNRAALLVTMNQPAKEIETRLAGHEASRLLSNARVVNVASDHDYRRRRL